MKILIKNKKTFNNSKNRNIFYKKQNKLKIILIQTTTTTIITKITLTIFQIRFNL